ncbi:cytochrome C assembly protein [Candidatus Nitrosoglobus terrae]|uniref:Cytochrome C assembly protein n=1 Tax=Candidatus Nitrosoglobus terrae TaxID=1630141 RepID=A0A1Q2SM75_9GAMM|nr:cytochrome c biogenesis protein CcsA [Candidatus Nitrosoglobus terrae]BAW80199.1 cytochrome C assembly protein [Candidatus Nitrosoglobus terrae]
MLLIPIKSLLGIICYCIASAALLQRLLSGDTHGISKQLSRWFGFAGVAFHAFVLASRLFTALGINLSFTDALSTAAWLMALLLLITSLKNPVENMGIGVYPFAAITLELQYLFPSQHIIIAFSAESSLASKPLEIHILISFIAYSLCALAAMHAILLAIQDRYIRNKRPGGFIRTLPPLQTMETLLFRILIAGFVLLSFSLLSGIIFLEDIFAQHLAHKTVFSIVAWLVFGILLWGRWRFGWRGQTAIYWTLSGFFFLMLAYFGSKLVLEIILHRV